MKIVEHQLGILPDYQYQALKHGYLFQKQWHRNRLILVKSLFNFGKNEKICDVGCGSGNVVLAFYQKVGQFDAADYNRDCLNFIQAKIRKNKIRNIKTFFWDILKPAKKELLNRYDKVIFHEVIEHFNQRQTKVALDNLKKILKLGGELLITTPNCGIGYWFLLELIIDKFYLFPKLWGEQHKTRFNRKSLKDIGEKNGFRVLKIGTFSLISPFAVIFGEKVADWLTQMEIKHLQYFGPQLFVHLKKIEV